MNLNLSESYLNGAYYLASSASVWMGPSFSQVYLFEPDGFPEALGSFAKLKEEHFEPFDGTFPDLVYQLFGKDDPADKRISDALIYVTENEIGEAGAVSVIRDDKLSIIERKNSPFPFFFADGAAIVTFPECVMLMVTGNNE